ncbi:MAG: PAS domain S-box protein [Desulfurivibrionaceae bacterium]
MKKNIGKAPNKQLSLLKKEIYLHKKEVSDLRKSEKRYRDILEHANDLIHSLDYDGKILYVNKLWRETLGYSTKEATNMKIFEIIHPNCQGKCESIFKCLMRGEILEPTETIFITKDGQKIFVEGRCNPKIEEGNAVELLGIFRDITARKKLEVERETLISELQEALANIKILEKCLPICASCKQIRDDKGYWNQIESYITKHSGTTFSHSICPECAKKLYPKLVK